MAAKASEELAKAFDSIAKVAMQASALSSDPNVLMIEKVRNAHSSLSLIVDDAMRGMNRATDWAIGNAVLVGAKGQHEQ
jgi:hypothetical protein